MITDASQQSVRIRRLDRELLDTRDDVGDLGEGAFRRLQHRDAVVRVSDGLVDTTHLRIQAGGDREAGLPVLPQRAR